MEREREFEEQKGRVKERQDIAKLTERQAEKCHYMTSYELAKIMRANNPNAGYTHDDRYQRRREEIRTCGFSETPRYMHGYRIGIKDDLKKVGAVTNLAESKI